MAAYVVYAPTVYLFLSFTLVAALYIAAADADGLSHLPLPLRLIAPQTVAQKDHLPLLRR